jgi:predicted N-formylglutamate amidohydrolase
MPTSRTQERAHRLNTFHRPYHEAIDAEIDAFLADGISPVLVSIHSFTPAWKGIAAAVAHRLPVGG